MSDRYKALLRTSLRRHGVRIVTVTVTLIAVTLSVAITTLILIVIEGEVSWIGLLLAILIPSILAPTFSGRNFELIHKLDLAEERLRLLSITDELTQAHNRRHFFERIGEEFSRALRHNRRLSIALIDFDNFKEINDHYGHLTGDAVLRYASEVCRKNIRHADIFARYGGDEFVFLFPETDAVRATECLERILIELIQNPFQHESGPIGIQVSAGMATLVEAMKDVDELLSEADFSLYAAKRNGGNRVNPPRT